MWLLYVVRSGEIKIEAEKSFPPNFCKEMRAYVFLSLAHSTRACYVGALKEKESSNWQSPTAMGRWKAKATNTIPWQVRQTNMNC